MLTTGVTLGLFALALATALFGLQSSQNRFQLFIDKDQALLLEETTLYAQGLQMGQALRNIVMDPDNETAYGNMNNASKAFAEALVRARVLAADQPKVLQTLVAIHNIRDAHVKEQEFVLKNARDQRVALEAIRHKETPVWREIRNLLMSSIDSLKQQVQVTSDEMAAFTRKIAIISGVFGLLGLITSAILMFWLAHNILRQIGGEPAEALNVANAIAAGDFTQRINVQANDDSSLLATMEKMQNSLSSIVRQMQQSAEAIDVAANEISLGNIDLSARTEAQAAGLEQTAAAMEQITSTVRLNADNAAEGNRVANNAADMATQSGSAVSSAVNTMNDISESSARIVNIIAVIDSIAFQTNILALNAAVEAARAGEQGRGFAVVASEVRTLAQRSASAAADIKQLIDNSVERIKVGNDQITVAGDSVSGLMEAIQGVAVIMKEITSASQEQSVGIGEIDQAVRQIDDTTQQNAALVQEATAAAQSLKDQARRLTEMASQFRLSSDTSHRSQARQHQRAPLRLG